MSHPQDRLLEHALYEALGGDGADAPDLAPAIREAWERSVPPGVDRGARPRPGRKTRRDSGRDSGWESGPRTWWLPLLAAGAMAAVGVGALWYAPERAGSSDPDEPQEARLAQADPQPGPQPENTPSGVAPQAVASSLSADLLERAGFISEALTSLGEPALPPEMRREILTAFYREGPLAELRRTPELWPEVKASAEALLRPGGLPPYARTALLDVLAVDPSPEVMGLVRAAWLTDPEVFSLDAIVVMAERGAFEFEREALAWLKFPEASPYDDAFTLALWGALRGDDRGAFLLEAELTGESKDPERPILAAVALARLGGGVAWLDYWEAFSARLRDQLDEADLDDDQLTSVTRAIDAWTYAWALHDRAALPSYLPTQEWDGVPRAGNFRHWLDLYYAARGARTRRSLAEELSALAGR